MKQRTSLPCFLLLIISFFFIISCKKSDWQEQIPEAQNRNTAASVMAGGAAAKPNVILIVGDDIGYEIPTVNGGQSYSTPTLDRLSRQGMMFTQCHSSPLCSPSRNALITGKYNFRNYFEWGRLPLSEHTIANMLSDAGYKTCVSGKWQYNGGEESIETFGFQNYCVWDPYEPNNGMYPLGSMYKEPQIYKNGKYLPMQQMADKYGPDVFDQYAKDFIDSNRNQPFFLYYPMVLCHDPFSPTPDDEAFAMWNPDSHISDTSFFHSMVSYMDKKIEALVNKVESAGLANRTLILFTGDNGTPMPIYSLFNGNVIKGGKSKTNEYGTHVPLIAYMPSHIKPGINMNLVDFTDFLPTLADVAGIPQPASYGKIDGISFFKQLLYKPSVPREWIFNHYNAHPDVSPLATVRWVQNTNYKLYEGAKTGFYNIVKDIFERNPISDNKLTPAEKETKDSFQAVLDSMH